MFLQQPIIRFSFQPIVSATFTHVDFIVIQKREYPFFRMYPPPCFLLLSKTHYCAACSIQTRSRAALYLLLWGPRRYGIPKSNFLTLWSVFNWTSVKEARLWKLFRLVADVFLLVEGGWKEKIIASFPLPYPHHMFCRWWTANTGLVPPLWKPMNICLEQLRDSIKS